MELGCLTAPVVSKSAELSGWLSYFCLTTALLLWLELKGIITINKRHQGAVNFALFLVVLCAFAFLYLLVAAVRSSFEDGVSEEQAFCFLHYCSLVGLRG